MATYKNPDCDCCGAPMPQLIEASDDMDGPELHREGCWYTSIDAVLFDPTCPFAHVPVAYQHPDMALVWDDTSKGMPSYTEIHWHWPCRVCDAVMAAPSGGQFEYQTNQECDTCTGGHGARFTYDYSPIPGE